MNLYSLYDSKTRTYNRPFVDNSDITAVRNLRMEVNRQDGGNVLYMFPEDYQLMKVGSFDQETGAVSAQTPELVVACDTLLSAKLSDKTQTPSRQTA